MIKELIQKIIGKAPAKQARLYSAAKVDRLTSSWTITNTSADSDIRIGLRTLRARSRDLSQNNDYARRFLKLVVTNIIGHAGIKFQCKAKDPGGRLDQVANLKIEEAWSDWGKSCTLDEQLTWLDIQRIVAESVARDGEVFVKLHRGTANKYGLALQLLEADHLDETYNDENKRIRMGIEYDTNEKPAAYWLWSVHPGSSFATVNRNVRVRVPASDIIHIYLKERPSQNRGVPWMHSAMTRLNNLGAYEEAEIVAARVGASSMGVITTPTGEEFTGEKDSDGNVYMEVEPGVFQSLPEGCDFKMFNPTHPAGNFGPFMKATLRGIAGGVNISYHALSNDLESVNYSSLRAGALDERDAWMMLQSWLIHNFCNKIYAEWLAVALLSALPFPYTKLEKFNAPYFQGRRWQWVDPEKDVNANIIAINNKLKTRTQALAEEGLDFYEVVDQLALEEEYIKSKGLTLIAAPAAPVKPAKEDSNAKED